MTKLLLQLFAKGDPTSAKVRAKTGKLSGAVGIVCNILLFLMKIVVGVVSGAVSITADAMNNLSDATSSVVTLIGFKLAEKPADEDHPYGHARYEYLSGLAVAAMIIVIGFELGKTSVEKIITPEAVKISWPVLLVLTVSILVKLWLSLFQKHVGQRIHSQTIMASAADSRNDVLTTGAVLAALLVELFTSWKIDGFMGLGVAVFILYSGVTLAKQTISPLLGETASPELREAIVSVVCAEPKVLGYHDLMVHDYGPGQRFASMHVEMDEKESAMECHEIIDNLERICLNQHNIHLVIHYDPVITGNAEMDRLRERVLQLLQQQDARITIHDFRMVQGKGHTNLIFDVSLPAELMTKKKAIKAELDTQLNQTEGATYYTVITFDLSSFNT